MRRWLFAALAGRSINLSPARAADWVSVAKFPDVDLEFDLAGIVREGDFARSWDRATYQADQGGPGSGDSVATIFSRGNSALRVSTTRLISESPKLTPFRPGWVLLIE